MATSRVLLPAIPANFTYLLRQCFGYLPKHKDMSSKIGIVLLTKCTAQLIAEVIRRYNNQTLNNYRKRQNVGYYSRTLSLQ